MLTQVNLPIESIKDKILEAYETCSNIILKASPGSGKTTRVPLYLLEKTQKNIYVLEPRRLAAKLAARAVANSLGEEVGQRVGYIFRYEKAVSNNTRIFFLTEGTFLKILSQNKSLDDVGIIILDEFHERHLSTDAALSFSIKLKNESRPDLKIMVMSATIETLDLQNYLKKSGPTTSIELTAHRFPLKVNYLPNVTSVVNAPLEKKVFNAISEILTDDLPGDILVFLPGMREIRDCQRILANLCSSNEIHCLIMHGDLDAAEQDQVLTKGRFRKIILSTNIAESSVTIPGIRIVIDTGLQRESFYNFFSGLPELNITKISRASATQRSGRSNREGEGICFRLYPELDYDQRPYMQKPEIEKSDLSELYLSALDLFDTSLDTLSWLLTPPANALKNSLDLLFSINAIDERQKITSIGKKILTYPLHPRLGRVLVEAEGVSEVAHREALIFLAEFLKEADKGRFIKMLSRKFGHTPLKKTKSLEEILLSGFPDRVARSRGENFFDVITQNGETIKIAAQIRDDFTPMHPLWIVMDLNNKGEALKIISIEEDWIYNLTPFPIKEESRHVWEEKREQVIKIERLMLGKIVLSEIKTSPQTSNAETIAILMDKAQDFLQSLTHTQEYERLQTLNKLLSGVDLSTAATGVLKDFFSNQFHFRAEEKDLIASYFYSACKDLIDPAGQFNLEIDFPMTIQLSDRRKIPVIYDHTQDPSIESFIQDFYGLTRTPLLAQGKIPLTLKLLGPHKRAIQVTQDLESFWKNTYPRMYKELSREYPRHHWPLDPKTALPILLKRQLPS